MLIKQGANWHRVNENCEEHMWVKGTLAGRETLLGVAYLWSGDDSEVREKNEKLVSCIKRDLDQLRQSGEVILVGDMNAHIEDLDGYTDRNGKLVLDMCEDHNLIVVNRETKCEGQITWERGDKQSSIDYSLLSEGVYERLTVMEIDEIGAHSLGSDHKRIALTFGKMKDQNPKTVVHGFKLNDKQIANIAKSLETEIDRQPTKDWEYSELIGFIQGKIRNAKERNCWKGKRKPRSWWNKEIKEAITQRQQASREHREAKRAGIQTEEIALKWNWYRQKKLEVQKLVQQKLKRGSERWVSNIRAKDKGAPRKFWNHIKELGKKTEEVQSQVINGEGQVLKGEEAVLHIRSIIQEKFRRTERELHPVASGTTGVRTDRELKLEKLNWKKAEENVPTNTATGSDEIPIRLVNLLGPKGKAQLIRAIKKVIKTKQVPEDWRKSRMKLIYKGKGDKDDANSYRPITVTSVTYRLAMQAIKAELQAWMEGNGVLGELQNGFRRDRRLEDNLFVLTQCIEVAMAQKRPLWIAFLDIKGAYDNVDRELLWSLLEREGLGQDLLQLLQEIYNESEVQITWEGLKCTEPVITNRGLKQGCPLSPLLFMLYMAGLERKLEDSKVGFNLCFRRNGQEVEQHIPGLIYADDIVLLADNEQGLQQLTDMCGEEATELGLEFSTEKSGVLVFNDDARNKSVLIQQATIPQVTKYKYLGIWINEGQAYLKTHEEHLRMKGKRNASIMKHRALWGYNKYEVVRGIWKGVMVPALTFSNAVVCVKSETQSGLEVNQRAVGRLALGAHSKTTNEAVQGDMGWASFEVREAQSKICFEERLRNMDDQRWAARMLRYLYMKSVDTQWRKRTRRLRTKYIKPGGAGETTKEIKKNVKEAETTNWEKRMEAKKSLAIYRIGKRQITREKFFDNTKGSALLFEARAGCLRTKTLIREQVQDELCAGCGREPETMRHIVTECKGIRPVLGGGDIQLPEALGFKVNEKVNGKAVEVSKRRLECWWEKSREEARK